MNAPFPVANLLGGMHPPRVPPADPNPGRRILYLPHRLFVSAEENSLGPGDSPVQTLNDFFPFHRPVGLLPQLGEAPGIGVLRFRLRRLERSRYITNPVKTSTATAVYELGNNTRTRLRFIQRSDRFWDNVCLYASPNGPNEPQPHINTWQLPLRCRVPLPAARAQGQAVKRLAALFLLHHNTEAPVEGMTSEASVQAEVYHQLIQPLNELIKTRYIPITHVGFPQWASPCQKLHSSTQGPKAGHPDLLLRRSDNALDHAAVLEIKPWWTYDDGLLTNLGSDDLMANGEFSWEAKTETAKLLRQLWGEMFFYRSDFGFFANGREVMVFAKSDQNTIILSTPRPWDHEDILQGLEGLTFAAIDSRYLNAGILINQYLCHDRHRIDQ